MCDDSYEYGPIVEDCSQRKLQSTVKKKPSNDMWAMFGNEHSQIGVGDYNDCKRRNHPCEMILAAWICKTSLMVLPNNLHPHTKVT